MFWHRLGEGSYVAIFPHDDPGKQVVAHVERQDRDRWTVIDLLGTDSLSRYVTEADTLGEAKRLAAGYAEGLRGYASERRR